MQTEWRVVMFLLFIWAAEELYTSVVNRHTLGDCADVMCFSFRHRRSCLYSKQRERLWFFGACHYAVHGHLRIPAWLFLLWADSRLKEPVFTTQSALICDLQSWVSHLNSFSLISYNWENLEKSCEKSSRLNKSNLLGDLSGMASLEICLSEVFSFWILLNFISYGI